MVIDLLVIPNEYLLYDTHESVPTQQRERMVIDLLVIPNEYPLYDTHESVPTQQRERMVIDPVNQYHKL